MKRLDLSFDSPEANLAYDEALLDAVDNGQSDEILRFWTTPVFFVVLGYSNKISEDVNLVACEKNNIPILRRISGGGTVLQGPGCLNYSLILNHRDNPKISGITSTNHWVMGKNQQALQDLLGTPVTVKGITDLALGEKKFSGNAQRRKKNALLFHGTFLLDFDLSLIEKYLLLPPRQPDYRQNRTHLDFLTNIHQSPEEIKQVMTKIWGATS